MSVYLRRLQNNQWLIDYQIPLIVIARQPKFQRLWALLMMHKVVEPNASARGWTLNCSVFSRAVVFTLQNNPIKTHSQKMWFWTFSNHLSHISCTMGKPSPCRKDTIGSKKEVQLWTLKATWCKRESFCMVLYIREGTRPSLRKIGPVTFRLLPKPDNSLPSPPAHFLLLNTQCNKCYKCYKCYKCHKCYKCNKCYKCHKCY